VAAANAGRFWFAACFLPSRFRGESALLILRDANHAGFIASPCLQNCSTIKTFHWRLVLTKRRLSYFAVFLFGSAPLRENVARRLFHAKTRRHQDSQS